VAARDNSGAHVPTITITKAMRLAIVVAEDLQFWSFMIRRTPRPLAAAIAAVRRFRRQLLLARYSAPTRKQGSYWSSYCESSGLTEGEVLVTLSR